VLVGGEGKLHAPVEIHYGVFATRPKARFEVVRDNQVVFSSGIKGDVAVGKWVDESVEPGPHVYYLRAVQGRGRELDMAWASPVFVTVLEGEK
jgi:hypothetical protein